MSSQEPLSFGFWEDAVPMVASWTFAALLMIAGVVLIVGIFTAPVGILLIVWAARIAGKSFVKHWSNAYDRRMAEQRNSPC